MRGFMSVAIAPLEDLRLLVGCYFHRACNEHCGCRAAVGMDAVSWRVKMLYNRHSAGDQAVFG